MLSRAIRCVGSQKWAKSVPITPASINRCFSADHSAHAHHGHHGPWSAKHEESNYDAGHPFGVGPKYKWEGYELPTLVLYAVMFWTLWDIDNREPEEMSLEEWAKNEALAREKAIENGEKIQFGKYYWRPDHLTLSSDEWGLDNQLNSEE